MRNNLRLDAPPILRNTRFSRYKYHLVGGKSHGRVNSDFGKKKLYVLEKDIEDSDNTLKLKERPLVIFVGHTSNNILFNAIFV